MATRKQRAAAKRNIKKAANGARRKRTIAHLPKSTRTALGKKEPRLQERNETTQHKGRLSSSSLLMQYRLQLSATHFRPPFRPPLRELDLRRFFPRPPPPFFRRPLSDLFTLAHARRSASLLLTPRFSYPSRCDGLSLLLGSGFLFASSCHGSSI